jgi:hypothetical protein
VKPGHQTLEEHEEVTKHVTVQDMPVGITIQPIATVCAKIPWQDHAQNQNLAGIQKVWRSMDSLEREAEIKRCEKCGLPPKSGKGVNIQELLLLWGYRKVFSWKPQSNLSISRLAS